MADHTALVRGDLDWVVGRGKGSVTDLERILKAPPGSVDLWRRGATPVPKAAVEEIRFFRRVFEFEDRVKALALPDCAEDRALLSEIGRLEGLESETRALGRARDRWLDHKRGCPNCQANEARISREIGPSPFLDGRTIDTRLSVTFTSWARRPWTLLLSLPALTATTYAAFRDYGPGRSAWGAAYLILAGFSLKFVVPAVNALWRRMTD